MGEQTVRRFAPLAVAALVLVLVGGVWAVVRGGAGSTTSPGSGSGGGVAPLRLDGWLPASSDTPDPRYSLADGTVLPEGPGSARVHRVLPRDAAGLRSVLGDLAPTFVISPQGSWTFGDPLCAVAQDTPTTPGKPAGHGAASDATTSAAGVSSVSVGCVPGMTRIDPIGLPGLRVVLEALDTGAGAVDENGGVPQADESRRFDIDPVVAGLPTSGLRTTLVVQGKVYVVRGNGWLVRTRERASYPIVTASEAYQQLRRTPLPMPLVACPEPLPPDLDPVTCGGPVTVTGAELGLSLQQAPDGPLLVPSWFFHVQGSSQPLVQVAVDPQLLLPAAPSAGGGSSGSGGSGVVPPATPSAVPPSAAPPPGPGEPVPDPAARFTSVLRGDDDRTLEVTFWGGVDSCYSYAVRAEEDDRRVKLFLVEQTPASGKACIDLAQEHQLTVTLQQPLGLRTVEDGESGVVLLGPAT